MGPFVELVVAEFGLLSDLTLLLLDGVLFSLACDTAEAGQILHASDLHAGPLLRPMTECDRFWVRPWVLLTGWDEQGPVLLMTMSFLSMFSVNKNSNGG